MRRSEQRLVILGAESDHSHSRALLDWNEFCLCAFGDNFSPAPGTPQPVRPVLPVKEALSAAPPTYVLLGVLDESEAVGWSNRPTRWATEARSCA